MNVPFGLDEENLKEAAADLYTACLNAAGAYEALKLVGADRYLPGYDSCLRSLNEAIAKAQGKKAEAA